MIGDGGILSLSVVRALAAEGITDIHEVSVNPVPVEMSKNSRYLNSYITRESFEKLDPRELIEGYSKSSKPVLIPVTVQASRWLSKNKSILSTHFGVPPLADPNDLELVSDKWRLHRWLQSNGFDSPQTVVLNEKDEKLEQKLEEIGYPLILKSKTEIPHKNIFRLRNFDTLSEIKDKIKGDSEENIIQKVVAGADKDVSLLADNGKLLAYSMQTPVESRGLLYATNIKLFTDEELLDLVRRLVSKLEWSGVAHLDFRYDEESGNYYLIDFNARYWGTLLGSVCAGVNIPFMQYRQALDMEPEAVEITPVTFMMNRDAVEEISNRILLRKKRNKNFRIRNSELRFSLLDPLPELFRRYQ